MIIVLQIRTSNGNVKLHSSTRGNIIPAPIVISSVVLSDEPKLRARSIIRRLYELTRENREGGHEIKFTDRHEITRAIQTHENKKSQHRWESFRSASR